MDNADKVFIFINLAFKKGDVMITSEIRVNTIFPSTLDTREGATQLAQLIREQIADNTRLDVDFKGIMFMSRSFADQFHKNLIRCFHLII